MATGRNKGPIFVHASQRSGSTYFFNVLRRMDSLICFDEAINDYFGHYGKEHFVRRKSHRSWNWSHNFLDRYSQTELVEAWDEVMNLYPPAPAFRDYVPATGVLAGEVRRYLGALIDYAAAREKRAAFCEIYSRGRAAALKDAFGGFHIAQYRDPLSQFGSAFRALQEFGAWTFLIIPLQELGLRNENPLYSIVPREWRVPALPWPANDRAQRWASTEEYVALILSSDQHALERVFRWHLLSWILNNLAAVAYSDFALDIDKAYDDLDYRQSVREVLRREVETNADFSNLTKFSRYYRFEDFDICSVTTEVVAVIKKTQENGELDAAVASLAKGRPTLSSGEAVRLLCAKIDAALAGWVSTDKPTRVTRADWSELVRKHRHIWANPRLRTLMQKMYPLALPMVQAARNTGLMR